MIILNFTHPLTGEHKAQIEALAGMNVDEVRDIPVRIEQGKSLAPQISDIVDAVRFTAD